MRAWVLIPLVIGIAGIPALAETRVENGVRVHRTASDLGSRTLQKPERVGIRLDRTFGARPDCASADWRQSVSRTIWEARCSHDGYSRWYDRWMYRGY